MMIIFDIDGTLQHPVNSKNPFGAKRPDERAIVKLKQLKAQGHTLIAFSNQGGMSIRDWGLLGKMTSFNPRAWTTIPKDLGKLLLARTQADRILVGTGMPLKSFEELEAELAQVFDWFPLEEIYVSPGKGTRKLLRYTPESLSFEMHEQIQLPACGHKPNPAGLQEILNRHGNPKDALFVGDWESDRVAAIGANCAFEWAYRYFQGET